MNIFKKETVIIAAITILVAAVIFLSGQYYIALQRTKIAENTVLTYQHSEKILDFTKLFIIKVLKSEGAVSFEDRLKLENTVRDINDKDIFDQWQKFTNSKTQIEAQIEVKNLLELLVNKFSY